MRARLLDMGEVSAVRSHSLFYAVADGLEAASDPVVVLVKPASPIVSVGGGAPAAVDLEPCRAERIPVVRSRPTGEVRFHAPGHLLVQLAAPAARAAELGLGDGAERWPEAAARPLLAVCAELGLAGRIGAGVVEVGNRAIARFEACRLAQAVAVWWELFVASGAPERRTEARVLAGSGGLSAAESLELLAANRTAFGAELAEPPGFGEIAEALVAAIEASLDLEMVPSMPTPAEMEAVYDWDHRLLVSELPGSPGRGSGVTTYLM